MNAVHPSLASRPESGAPVRRVLWRRAMRQRSVWMRAFKLGLTVGLLQAMINQGDHWLNLEVDGTVVTKTVVSPLIGFSLVLFSAAQTWVERTRAGELR